MFTEQAREVIAHAQDEARDMGHGAVGVEHLLLGLFSDQDGIARVFADFGVTIEPVRDLVRERLGAGSESSPELPFSEEAKEALRAANRWSLGKPGIEYVLLAIVGRGEGSACDILRALGADPHRLRFETKKLTSPSSLARPGATRGRLDLVGAVPLGSIPELDFGD